MSHENSPHPRVLSFLTSPSVFAILTLVLNIICGRQLRGLIATLSFVANQTVAERFVLFGQYYDELVRHLTVKLQSPDRAQDVAQETFLRVLSQDSSAPIDQPRAFLYKAAFNLTVDLYRRQQCRSEESLDAEGTHPAFIVPAEQETVLAAKEQVRLLSDALMELPPRCRHVFFLHKFKERSHAEIAAHLGISISMVEKHVVRATTFCRDRFKDIF